MAGSFMPTAITGNEVKLEWQGWDDVQEVKIWRSTTAIADPPTGLTDDMLVSSGQTGVAGTVYDYSTNAGTAYYYIFTDGNTYVKANELTTPSKGEMKGDYVPVNMNKIDEDKLYVNNQNANGVVAIPPVPVAGGKYLTIVAFESTAAMTDLEVNTMITNDSNISKAQLVAYMNVKTISGYNQNLNGTLQLKYVAQS